MLRLASGDVTQAQAAAPVVEIFPAVQSGSFVEGSTFEVPILINTRGVEINTVTLDISFDSNLLSIVSPSGGKSIVGLWFEPPTYDNVSGSERLGGIITNGITTEAGLITTITFKARASGQAVVSINPSSRVLLNDGLGTDAQVSTVRGSYTLLPSPPGAVAVYSGTHPLPDRWYNNPNPSFTWEQYPAVTRYAWAFDTKPNTIPDTSEITIETLQAFENLADGVWYFHIMAEKDGVWGATSHHKAQIDTTPPAAFKPSVSHLSAGTVRQAQVAFLTTDSLSGIAYYEVGASDLNETEQASPVFIQAGSPYQIQLDGRKHLRVTIRAFDQAGNSYDEVVTVRSRFEVLDYFEVHTSLLLVGLLGGLLGLALLHYVIGHHLLSRLKRAYQAFRINRTESL